MSDTGEPEEEHGYEVVMPFVIVQSVGGPFDDDAFVVGWECGAIDALLAQKPEEFITDVHTAAVPQMDLIAMKHGFTATFTETGIEGWTGARFVRGGT